MKSQSGNTALQEIIIIIIIIITGHHNWEYKNASQLVITLCSPDGPEKLEQQPLQPIVGIASLPFG